MQGTTATHSHSVIWIAPQRRTVNALLAALSPAERETLGSLLRWIADQRQLTRGVHPGFARIRQEVSTGRRLHEPNRGMPGKG